MNDIELRVKLLELEVEALRSVLSEWDADKYCFTQWGKAEAVRDLINYLKRSDFIVSPKVPDEEIPF